MYYRRYVTLLAMLKLGRFELHSVVNGTVRLDGGAMFGVVPKVLWQKVTDVDDSNRILLSTRTFVAVDRTAGHVILVDTGCGTKWEAKQAARYAVHHDPDALSGALQALGLQTDAVTDVVITHLHFDHNGGLTYWYDDPGGPTRLRFPQARHWVHKDHWEHAHNPTRKDRASFLKEDFEALGDAGVLSFVEGDRPAGTIDGVEWLVSCGHTPSQLHPVFKGDGEQLLFAGDLIPTAVHLPLSWVMAYDLRPLTTIAEKEAIYRRCAEEGLMLAFPHDPTTGGVAIEGPVEKPIVTRSLPL